MFDTVGGLPVHALVVHAVVVLVPLASLGVLALAARPMWRSRYGWLVVAVTAGATATVPVAARSGEALASRVGTPTPHAELGRTLIYFVVPLLALVIALVVLDRHTAAGGARRFGSAGSGYPTGSGSSARSGASRSAASRSFASRSGAAGANRVTAAVAVLAAVVAVAAAVQVFRIGESGAEAHWSQIVQSTRPGQYPVDG